MTIGRDVNCYTCGQPTGERSPDGQAEFPVCRGCRNLPDPYHPEVLYNQPGQPNTLFCADPHRRNNVIRERGNGIYPYDRAYQRPNAGLMFNATGIDTLPVPEDEEQLGFACVNCGQHGEFYLMEEVVARRYYETYFSEVPTDRPRVSSDYCDDTDVMEVRESWAECSNCGHRYDDFDHV